MKDLGSKTITPSKFIQPKLFLILLAGVFQLALGQGVVNFGNISVTGRVATNTVPGGPTTGLMAGPAGTYYFGLFVAPTTQTFVDPLMSGWTFTGNYGTNSPTLAGRFTGNYTSDPGVAVSGYAPGSTANFVVAGWTANLGHDWSDVQAWVFNGWPASDPIGTAANYGVSSIQFNVLIGGGSIPVPTVPVQGFILPMEIKGFPEPSVLSFILVASVTGVVWRKRRRA